MRRRIRRYMADNPDVAVRVGMDWLVHSGAGWEVLFWDELPDFVGDVDAFLAGEGRNLDRTDAWVVLGPGGFSTMSDRELVSRMAALGRDPEFCDAVIGGSFRVPDEMAATLGLPRRGRR